MEATPVLKQVPEIGSLLLRQGFGLPASLFIFIGGGRVEALRVGKSVQEGTEIGRQYIGHEPRHRLTNELGVSFQL